MKQTMIIKINELIDKAKAIKTKDPLGSIDLLKQAFNLTIENNLIAEIGLTKLDRLMTYSFKVKQYTEVIPNILILLQYSKTENLTKWLTFHYYDLLYTAYLYSECSYNVVSTFIKRYIEHKKYFYAIGDFKTLEKFPIDKYETDKRFIELLKTSNLMEFEKKITEIVNTFVNEKFTVFSRINQLYMNKIKLNAMLSIDENEIDEVLKNRIGIII